ncbi:site-specific integrase [Flavonifractor sp. An100]|uniref:tyrosine-type recombinase/integrase n=1 Tax=Flavonifractor sp. An100 TaxID=1965538 RepID=UPI000B3AE9A2|nr:site-specific integrase [Flavonifractor sp. An100]OUQ75907.1 site-specific integrase [Flavonifractor sp. An100]
MAKRRKRGDGSLHLRKDGRWEGRVVVGYDEKGRPKTKNVLAKTKSECSAKLKALKASLQEQKPEKPKGDMTFGTWLDHWYQRECKPQIRPKTQADYENRIYQHIIPELGSIPLAKLTAADLQQFYNRLKEGGRLLRVEQYGPGLSDRMVKSCHVTCRMALDQAVAQGLILKNPALSCKAPVTRPKEMQVLTGEEIQRLLIQAKEDGCFELLLLELTTGLRRGEILALRWDDLDFRTGVLRVERQVQRIRGKLVVSQPKTRASSRSILLPTPVLKILEQYRQSVTSQWMFPSPRKGDSPRDPTAVRKKLSAVLKRVGCPAIRFHDLRHTFATSALEHGMDVKTLSTVIGHVSSATTLNVYAHVTDEMWQKAADKIDRAITGREPPQGKAPKPPGRTAFQPVKGKYRKPGTGCISQINDHLWEGRYSPKVNGRRMARNVYAKTEAECEEKLAELIREMKAEIAAGKERQKQGGLTS